MRTTLTQPRGLTGARPLPRALRVVLDASTVIFVCRAVLLANMLLTAAASAQVPSPEGNIYGTVLDEQGSALQQTRITLTGPGAPRAAMSDAKGDFHFLNLSPGGYAVILERDGFATVRREVTVLTGKNAVLTITMPVAEAAEAVTVSGQTAVLDTRKTETGATFSQKELQTIPTTRDPAAILRQVPGVLLFNVNVGGEDSLFQPGFVGKGTHSDQNTYNVDGVAINEAYGGIPIYFDFDSFETLAVVTGGTDPSLTTPGVTLNLVTKRGTNQILGSSRVLYTETAGWDYGIEAGGPLWRDRLWLWGAFARNALLGQTIYNMDVPQEALFFQPTVEHWNAKLNAQLAADNSLTLSYVDSYKTNPGNEAGADRSPASTVSQVFPATAYRLEDSLILSSKLFASLSLSYLAVHNTNTPNGGLDQQAYLDEHYVWQYSFSFFDLKQPQYQAGVTSSAFFDTGDLRHELKFGFGYRQIRTDSLSVWPGNQLYGYQPNDPPGAAITRPARNKSVNNYYDVYAGDTVQLHDLTVNVGLRFDYQQGRNLPSSVPANPVFPELLPAADFAGNAGYPITWRQVEPRVGATYALGNGQKTILRASYSRYANRLNTETGFVGGFPGPATLFYVWNDANGDHLVEPNEVDTSPGSYPDGGFLLATGVDPNNPASTSPVNRAAKTSPVATNEFIVGAERAILTDLTATVAYTHRSATNFAFTPIIGTSRSSYHYIGNASGNVTGTTDGFTLNFSEPYYGLGACPPGSASCAGLFGENRPDFSETYNGVEVQLVKALRNGWALRASFAYNDWQQHVGPEANVNPNNMAGGSNVSGPVVENVNGSYINAKWQFNVSGMVQLPIGVEAAANLFGRQGYPIVYSVQAFTHDAANSQPFLQIGPVGAYRLPSVFVLDLHLEKSFAIGPAITISPMLDCFNLANSHTVLQRDGFVGSYDIQADPVFNPNGNFNNPIQYLNSRVLRGGVRITF